MMRIFPFVSVKETPQLCSAKKSFTVEVIALGGSVGETVKLRDREELLSVNLTFFDWYAAGATEVFDELSVAAENTGKEEEGINSCRGESAFLFGGNGLVSVSRVRISIAEHTNTNTISLYSWRMIITYVAQILANFVDVIVACSILWPAQPTLCQWRTSVFKRLIVWILAWFDYSSDGLHSERAVADSQCFGFRMGRVGLSPLKSAQTR